MIYEERERKKKAHYVHLYIFLNERVLETYYIITIRHSNAKALVNKMSYLRTKIMNFISKSVLLSEHQYVLTLVRLLKNIRGSVRL